MAPRPLASSYPRKTLGDVKGAAMSTVEVRVPDLGDAKGVAVLEVLGPEEGRERGRRRPVDYARVGEGIDGRAFAGPAV